MLSAMSLTMSLLFMFSFKPLNMALTLAPGADICFLASVTSWMSLSRQSSVLLAHALCLFTTFSASFSAKSMFSIVLGTSDDSLRLHQDRLTGPRALTIVYVFQLKEHTVVSRRLWEARRAIWTSEGQDLRNVMMCIVRPMGQVQPEGWAGALRMQAISAETSDDCHSDIRRRCTVPAP